MPECLIKSEPAKFGYEFLRSSVCKIDFSRISFRTKWGLIIVRRLIYHSIATLAFNRQELASLVRIAAHYNATVNVTGLLVYEGGGFLQVLEGPHASINKVMARVFEDQRHQEVTTVQDQAFSKRLFQNWAMHICDLREHPAVSEILNHESDFLRSQQKRESAIARMVDSLSAYYAAENLMHS